MKKLKAKPVRNGANTTLYLDEPTKEGAKIIGGGEKKMSAGVRIAVEAYLKINRR